ncbi:MAG: hypothetical protein HQL50_15025 [Magnetococcales bacterium]|nr:hypothetical protein [Magnetococcales bacterium]
MTEINTMKEKLKEQLKHPYLFLLFVASILLSLGSFYTTFDGMLDFMPIIPIAAFVTFAVQSLLFVTAWKIGFDKAQQVPRSSLVISVFAVSFFFSVLFSFSSLFNHIFDPEMQKRTRDTRVQNAVETTVTDIDNMMIEQHKTLVGEVVDSDHYVTWRSNVRKVVETAHQSHQVLSHLLEQSEEASTSKLQKLQNDLSRRKHSSEFIAVKLAEIDNAIREVEAKGQAVFKRLQELERIQISQKSAVRDKAAQAEAEERGGDPGKGRKAGKGPVYRGLVKELAILKSKLNGTRAKIKDESALKQRLSQELSKLRKQKITIKAERDESKTLIPKLQEKLQSIRSEKGEEYNQTRINLNTIIPEFDKYLDSFVSSFDMSAFKQASRLCSTVLAHMKQVQELQPKLSGLSCDYGALAVNLGKLNKAAGQKKQFQQECVEKKQGSVNVATLPFMEAVEFGKECINISGLPSDSVGYLRDELHRLIREESPNASPFVKTANALLAGDKLALFALGIALIIDLLVLFCGLIGAGTQISKLQMQRAPDTDIKRERNLMKALDVDLEPREEDSGLTVAFKFILSHAKPYRCMVENQECDEVLDLQAIDNDLPLEIYNAINILYKSKLIVPDPESPDSLYYLSTSARPFITDILEEAVAKEYTAGKTGVNVSKPESPSQPPSPPSSPSPSSSPHVRGGGKVPTTQARRPRTRRPVAPSRETLKGRDSWNFNPEPIPSSASMKEEPAIDSRATSSVPLHAGTRQNHPFHPVDTEKMEEGAPHSTPAPHKSGHPHRSPSSGMTAPSTRRAAEYSSDESYEASLSEKKYSIDEDI